MWGNIPVMGISPHNLSQMGNPFGLASFPLIQTHQTPRSVQILSNSLVSFWLPRKPQGETYAIKCTCLSLAICRLCWTSPDATPSWSRKSERSKLSRSAIDGGQLPAAQFFLIQSTLKKVIGWFQLTKNTPNDFTIFSELVTSDFWSWHNFWKFFFWMMNFCGRQPVASVEHPFERPKVANKQFFVDTLGNHSEHRSTIGPANCGQDHNLSKIHCPSNPSNP